MNSFTLPGYELGRLIGRGAMGEVYRATQTSLDRKVAIKILPEHLQNTDPSFLDRFRTEAKTVALLQHPNIVSIYDVGQAGNVTYIAMELVEGESLDELISGGELSFECIEDILRQLTSALDYAHRKGVVHRDIKPRNIFVTPDSRVLLMDFGIAKSKQSDADLTATGYVIGTPKYSAPEMLSGGWIDSRADLYSLGVLTFEMLAGEPPFGGSDPLQVGLSHLKDPVPDLTTLRPDVPRALKRAVERLLAKQPDERFDTAGEFIEAAFGKGRYPAPPARSTESVSAAKGGIFSALFSIFGRRSKPDSSRPAPAPAATPPAGEPDPIDRTYPPDTIIAPIPQPELPGDPFAPDQDLSERTMVVNVRTRQADGGAPIPVVLTSIASPDPGEIGRRIPLLRFPFVIGRTTDADLALSGDSGISRRHLEIDYHDGRFQISDYSSNGTFVNGKLLNNATAVLLIGDVLTLSAWSSLRFVADVSLPGNLSGLKLDDRYELTEELYSSMKAATYIGRDTQFPRTLAIKVFSPGLAALSDYHDAYEREADIAARLNHPNIRKVIERGEAEHTLEGHPCRLPYLCMDLMRRGNLTERLADEAAQPELGEIVVWIRTLGEALSYAHQAGVVHGGLKPNAILFDERDRAYLADFAQASTSESHHGAVALGSPAYMAPEQWDGLDASEATDQYAFACLCYLMLTGSTPYEGQSDPLVRARNLARGPVPAHQQADRLAISDTASRVIATAMSVDPEQRYPSIQAFTAELIQAFETGRSSDDRARIFLSYRRDASAGWAVLFARELHDKHTIEAFVDTERRDSAVHFPEKLKKAIFECDVFVCLLAGDTLDSPWVREEIRVAFEHGRPMIPVFQESYRTSEKHREPAIDSLLRYDGVHLLDRRNIHVDHTISDLAHIVRCTFEP